MQGENKLPQPVSGPAPSLPHCLFLEANSSDPILLLTVRLDISELIWVSLRRQGPVSTSSGLIHIYLRASPKGSQPGTVTNSLEHLQPLLSLWASQQISLPCPHDLTQEEVKVNIQGPLERESRAEGPLDPDTGGSGGWRQCNHVIVPEPSRRVKDPE